MQKNIIEKIVNKINEKGFDITDQIIKDTFFCIFNTLGNINPGIFEFLFQNAIKETLMGYYNKIKDRKDLYQEIYKSLEFPNILLESFPNNVVVLTMGEYCVGGSYVIINLDLANKKVLINIIKSNYLTLDSDIDEYYDIIAEEENIESNVTYKYDYNTPNTLEITLNDSKCKCDFDNEGIETKRELSTNKSIKISNEINRLEVFIEFYDEQLDDLYQYEKVLSDERIPEEVEAYLRKKYDNLDLEDLEEKINSLEETINALKIYRKGMLGLCKQLQDTTLQYFFVRDEVDFNMASFLYIENNNKTHKKTFVDSRDVYLSSSERLYQLNNFTTKEIPLKDYIDKLNNNKENQVLTNISLERLKEKNKRETK